jgi:uncharacterized membrane protein YphA (DoxX/SURF4 family)
MGHILSSTKTREVDMKDITRMYLSLDASITRFMRQKGILLLRLSLGIIFLWFGFLKFFPGLSPADQLATRTISALSFGMVPPAVSLFTLAAWETLIGVGLIVGKYLRFILFLLFTQMLGTLTPLFIFPSETFQVFPLVPTLEGQYIIKNLVLISAGMVVGATVRGGSIHEKSSEIGTD